MLLDCRGIIYVIVLGREWKLRYCGRNSDQAKAWTFRGANLGRGNRFLFQIVQTACGTLAASISMRTTVLPGVKQPERDVTTQLRMSGVLHMLPVYAFTM